MENTLVPEKIHILEYPRKKRKAFLNAEDYMKCPKCDGEFDFEEMTGFRPMGNYVTLAYDGHKLATYRTGYFGKLSFNCPHYGKRSKFNVASNPRM